MATDKFKEGFVAGFLSALLSVAIAFYLIIINSL